MESKSSNGSRVHGLSVTPGCERVVIQRKGAQEKGNPENRCVPIPKRVLTRPPAQGQGGARALRAIEQPEARVVAQFEMN